MEDKTQINIDRLIDLGSFEVTGAEKRQFEGELADFLEYARVINGAPLHLPPASRRGQGTAPPRGRGSAVEGT